MNAPLEGMLEVEQFLSENYLFRRNVLNRKIEFTTKNAEGGQQADFRPLTQAALNSIILRAKRLDLADGKPKTDIVDYIRSEEVPEFNPIEEFLNGLPKWDGENHVANLFGRLPGVSTEQLAFLSTWMRSTVAKYKWNWRVGKVEPAYIVGDANGNGEVEIGDVTSVLTLMATPEAEGYNNKAADANQNGEIEIGDVTTILTIMANGNQ